MKRGGPLKRNARLTARSSLKTKKGLSSKRKALKKKGSRAEREEAELARFRKEVRDRDGWRCRRCGSDFRPNAHHVLPKGRGGPNTRENGVTLCGGDDGCHMRVHRHEVADWRAWIR